MILENLMCFFFDDDSGEQLMGWHELKRDGNKDYFYFTINGTLTGWQKFETGGTFYFNEKGAM
jgi:glucan-binding YG repeat protein